MVEELFLAPLVQTEDGNIFLAGAYFNDEIALSKAIQSVTDIVEKSKELSFVNIAAFGSVAHNGNTTEGGRKDNSVVEAFACLVRSQHIGKDEDGHRVVTPRIHWYPDWQHNNKFGKFQEVSQYLNTEEDITTFEATVGIKLEELPLYNGQGSPQRSPEDRMDWEVYLETPIKVLFDRWFVPKVDSDGAVVLDENGKQKTSKRTRYKAFA